MIQALLLTLAFAGVWADAGKNQIVRQGPVQLHGRASHDFVWSQIDGPPARISNPKTLEPWVIASTAGKYTFMLIVSDGKQIVTSTVTVTIGDIA
jgi:hypothetical protein